MMNEQSSNLRIHVQKEGTFGNSFVQWIALLCGLWILMSSSVAQAEFLDRLSIIDLLRSGQFEKLEQMLAKQENLYQQVKIPEKHVEAAYLSFANSDPDWKLR